MAKVVDTLEAAANRMHEMSLAGHAQMVAHTTAQHVIAPRGAVAPKLDLPFQQAEAIDVRRVAKVLAISHRTVHYILDRGDLCGYRVGTAWRLEYSSLVDYCNRLRLHYGITEKRLLQKPSHGRLRDEDLLPFPIADTIYAAEVQKRLDIARATVSHLIEQGTLIAYQPLIGSRSCPYRIFRPSFERYLASLHAQAQSRLSERPRAYGGSALMRFPGYTLSRG